MEGALRRFTLAILRAWRQSAKSCTVRPPSATRAAVDRLAGGRQQADRVAHFRFDHRNDARPFGEAECRRSGAPAPAGLQLPITVVAAPRGAFRWKRPGKRPILASPA
jgi:hypothetical protein